MTIDTIIFDVGDVLHVLHDGRGRSAIFTQLGLTRPEQEETFWHLYKVGACTETEYWTGVLHGTYLEGKEEYAAATTRKRFASMTANGAATYIPLLKSQGYKLAILSNHVTEWLRPFLAHNNLEQYFDKIIISSEAKLAKPDLRIYQHALEMLGKTNAPDTCLFIDDKEKNILAAQNAGILGVRFNGNNDELKKELVKYGINM